MSNSSITLPTIGLTKGMYLMVLQGNYQTFTQKIIVQE